MSVQQQEPPESPKMLRFQAALFGQLAILASTLWLWGLWRTWSDVDFLAVESLGFLVGTAAFPGCCLLWRRRKLQELQTGTKCVSSSVLYVPLFVAPVAGNTGRYLLQGGAAFVFGTVVLAVVAWVAMAVYAELLRPRRIS